MDSGTEKPWWMGVEPLNWPDIKELARPEPFLIRSFQRAHRQHLIVMQIMEMELKHLLAEAETAFAKLKEMEEQDLRRRGLRRMRFNK
jgi:hypothetical protein